MNESLMVREDSSLTISFTHEAETRRIEALAEASLVTAVENSNQQQMAVDALQVVSALLKEVESQREEIKKPVLLFSRKIDESAKTFREEKLPHRVFKESLSAAKLRIEKLLADYVALQNTRIRAEQNQFSQSLSALETEREAKIANASSIEDIEAIREDYAQKAAALGPCPVAEKADGQMNRNDIEIEVTDIWLLARMHPTLVKCEPKRMDIKEAIKAGLNVQGVTWKEVVKVSARPTKTKTLDIAA